MKKEEPKELKLTFVKPVVTDTMSEEQESEFLRSADVIKMLNISNSTLKNLRTAQAIPFYKLGGTYLYNKEEIFKYLASNYSKRI